MSTTTDLPPADTTLGELRAAGHRSRSVKDEMRSNLLEIIRRRVPLLPGILGYDESVLPATTSVPAAVQREGRLLYAA